MSLTEQIKALAAKNSAYKYVILFLAFLSAGMFALLNMPEQSQQAITIGNEVAQVKVEDGKITDVVSATAVVSVTEVSATY